MKRIHLFEFLDLNWFPKTWHDLITDFISHVAAKDKMYTPVAKLLEPIFGKSDRYSIVDLCSGAGTPVLTVIDEFDKGIANKMQVTLTDKYPNVTAFKRISRASNGSIRFSANSIDATNVPETLQGFRTFFTSFHHFKKDSALAILADAVKKEQGIGIFEFIERKLLILLGALFLPLQVWLKTPFIRPFCWRRILWTYPIPIVPLVALWDASISCLRSYSVDELHELIKQFKDCGYSWQIGQIKTIGPFNITYLIGYPDL
ncbi:hypothetical protein ACFL0H_11830 [Thermodesulfobacteriota bacterium]